MKIINNKTMSGNKIHLHEKELAKIARGNYSGYSDRKIALDNIKDKKLLNDLAINAKDDWIKLESAIKCGNNEALLELIYSSNDEALRLEAALEVKNESILSEIAMNCEEIFHGSVAIGHVSDKNLLLKITEHAKYNRLKAEAAMKLGDIDVIMNLIHSLNDDWIRYQLAVAINHTEILQDLARSSTNQRVKKLANEWFDDIIFKNRSYKKSNYQFLN